MHIKHPLQRAQGMSICRFLYSDKAYRLDSFFTSENLWDQCDNQGYTANDRHILE
jgi:hypothetical protein